MKRFSVLATLLTMTTLLSAAPVEFEFWHAMGGRLGEKVNELSTKFNESQSAYKVVPVFKGSYAETMTAGIAAFRGGQAPAVMQVFEVGTATMMSAKGAIKPVYQLMKETGTAFNPASYLQAVAGYYTDAKGNMLSFPFNSSTPVLYYNKDAFRKAGLDPEKAPRTWTEVAEFGKKLLASGTYEAAYTSTWMSWIHLENFSAWHNIPSGTQDNGFGGVKTELLLNSPSHVRHIQRLADWQGQKLFVYGGRTGAASPKFVNGEVPMMTESSAGYAALKTNAKFDFGVAMMPFDETIAKAPQNSIIGGASLWVFEKQSPAVYKGVAQFFSFLSSPEIQADWHQFTGYLPITTAAEKLTRDQGFYQKNPGTDVSIRQINNKAPTSNSKGLRYGNMVQIRDIVDVQLEALFAGKQDAKKTLDEIVKQGNELLRKFERSAN